MKNFSLMALVIASTIGLASVAEARTYCYETYTGKFLHWGSCYRHHVVRTPGRTYCYRKSDGTFLNWGACR